MTYLLFLALWFLLGVIGNAIGAATNNYHYFKRYEVTRADLFHPLLIFGPFTLGAALVVAYAQWRDRRCEHMRRMALRNPRPNKHKGVDINV